MTKKKKSSPKRSSSSSSPVPPPLSGGPPSLERSPSAVPALSVWIVGVMLFVSGGAALIYQVVWTRQIGLFLGHTDQAAALVLAAIFAGMALGNLLAASWLRRPRFALLGYGLAEIAVALWAWFLPSLWPLLESPALAVWLASSSWQGIFYRGLACFLLLLPATTALGITWPCIAAVVSSRSEAFSSKLSLVYGFQIFGAVLGVALTTFVFFGSIGVSASGTWAAILSALCGALALWLVTEDGDRSPLPDVPPFLQGRKASWRWFVWAGISGFAVLALEILYTRLFALVFHNSSYTFGLVLMTALLGLALGSWLAGAFLKGGTTVVSTDDSRLQTNPRHLQTTLGIVSLLASGLIALSLLLFLFKTKMAYFPIMSSFSAYLAAAWGLVLLVALPPFVATGMLLPLVWAMALAEGESEAVGEEGVGAGSALPARGGGEGREKRPPLQGPAPVIIGHLTAWNTLAGVCGALGASFVLPSVVGLWGSFLVVAALFLVGVFCLQRRPGFASVLLLGLFLLATLWITSFYPKLPKGEVLVERWTSAYGLTDVVSYRGGRERRLRQDLHYSMGSSGSKEMERRQGHLPLLLHPKPKDVLFLGLATGITASAALLHPSVEKVAVVELLPQIGQAARLFGAWNEKLLDSPKVWLFEGDARVHLAQTSALYDLIVSDLFVPWESKTGYLYSAEHFKRAKARLQPQGLFCQWLPVFQLDRDGLALIARTFASVFPHVTVWLGTDDPSHLLLALVGSEGPLRLDAASIKERLAAAKPDPLLASPSDLFRLSVGEWPASSEGPLNTEDKPLLEFSAPAAHGDDRLLSGDRARQFYEEILAPLSRLSLYYIPSDGSKLPLSREIRAWQSKVIGLRRSQKIP